MDVVSVRGLVFFFGFIDRGAERQHQALSRYCQHVEARRSRGWFEERTGRPTELQNLQRSIDEHSRWRELVDGDAVGLTLRVEVAIKTVLRLWRPHGDSGSRPSGGGPLSALRTRGQGTRAWRSPLAGGRRRVIILKRCGLIEIVQRTYREFKRLPGDIRIRRNPREFLRNPYR